MDWAGSTSWTNWDLGGCLADDMGLGKTIQVLAMLEAGSARRPRDDGTPHVPSLVVVPKSLVFNWIDEAQRFTPRVAGPQLHWPTTGRHPRRNACKPT